MKGFFDVHEQNRLHGICENGGKRPHGAVCAALLPCDLLGGYERTEPERHVYEAAGQRAVYHSGGIGFRLCAETERPDLLRQMHRRRTAGGMPDGHGSERLSLWLCRRAASGGDGSMIIKVGIHFNTKQLHAKSAALKQQAQEFVGNELLRKCDPYVPFDTGMLRDSGISHSKPAEGYLLWKTPYAAVQWYAGVSRGLRGKKWALRAWADHGKLILKSARSIAKGKV
nr:MAG TPA: Minor capsid protein [Caudoviricetes sp.]